MEIASLRPKLISFRATSFHGENKAASSGQEPWNIELTQTIEVGLGATRKVSAPLLAMVTIDFLAKAFQVNAQENSAEFSASYEAKFDYPVTASEAEIAPLFEREPYQYMLIAQVFPLAMTHFRREMQSMGFDARQLPLGI